MPVPRPAERPLSDVSMSAPAPPPAAAAVAEVLSLPDEQLDYAEAKVALDRLVDPTFDARWAFAELDRLTEAAWALAGPSPDEAARLAALRSLVYEGGPWNEHRPFAYDHDHPEGTYLPQKLLPVYLSTRLGNCVSMPILFLILGERLGLDLALARAPHHLFVRHCLGDGRIGNLETTSGALPARDEWFRRNMPMSELALETGLYMRSLGRREAVAAMATTAVEQLAQERRWDEVIAVCEVILRHSPGEVHALLSLGSACAALLGEEFGEEHPTLFVIPPLLRPRYLMLRQRNLAAFEAAAALGWEPDHGSSVQHQEEGQRRCL